MTPERIAELKSLYDLKFAPWGSFRGFEVIQECLAEIQRLQAALPTPAKEKP